MKVYTSIEYKMTDEGLEEVASESYEYEGPVAETKGGGGGTNTVVERHYYYDGGPGSQPNVADAVGIEGLVGATGATGAAGAPGQVATAPNLNPADTTPGLMPSGYSADAIGGMAGGTMTPTAPTAIAPVINYSNPYELMNQMQPPTGIAGLDPNNPMV